ncbi:hypothetical protein KAS08_03625 [Candidatus Pacearchaeota archaeon]|nr:hypothetical protein [Candidatus Pacearchaeota archaeon]
MNSKKKYFILTLLGILTLMLLGNFKESQTGTIQEIKTSAKKTTILLQENDIELIIFNSNINLQKGNIIKFYGKQDTYKNKEQIIIDKIWKTK